MRSSLGNLNLQTDDDIRYLKLDWDSFLQHYKRCGVVLRRVPVRDFDAVDLKDKLPACVSPLNSLLEYGPYGLPPLFCRCRPLTHSGDRLSLLALWLGLRASRRSCHTVPALLAQCRSDPHCQCGPLSAPQGGSLCSRSATVLWARFGPKERSNASVSLVLSLEFGL